MPDFLCRRLPLLLTFLYTAGTAFAGEFPLTLVALSGAEPPGRGSDFKHDEMDPPVVGRGGRVSYSAPVKYVGFQPPLSVNRYRGLYQGTPAAITWTTPGGPYPVTGRSGVFFLPQKGMVVNSSGVGLSTAAFVDNPAGVFPTLSGYGIVRGTGAAAELIYRVGDAAPGIPGATMFQFPNGITMNLNDSGRVTFTTLLSGTTVDDTNNVLILFTDTPGGLTKVVRRGDAVPGGGGAFTSFGEPATADDGSIAFGAAIDGSFRNTIWVRSPAGVLGALVRPGFAVPSVAGGTFASVSSAPFHVRLQADGTATFAAAYNTSGQPEKYGVFKGKPGNLQALVLDGIAPGTAGGAFTLDPQNLAESLRVNDQGTVVFAASWQRFTPSFAFGRGLFARYQGTIIPVVLSGAAAPGAPAGATFNTFDNYDLALNNQDKIVFYATISGGGVGSTNQVGLWSTDLATGVTKLLLRDSDMVEIAPGSSLPARLLSTGSGAPHNSRGGGAGIALSDQGRYVLKVRLTDLRYGIFSVELSPAVPTGLQQWRQTQYGSPANTGAGADSAVPGPDSLTNLIRYALGLSAGENGAADGSAPVSTVASIGGVSHMVLTFIRDPAATDVRLAVQVAENATAWHEGNIYQGAAAATANTWTTELSRTTLPDGRERITVRSNAPTGSTGRQFLRLAATVP